MIAKGSNWSHAKFEPVQAGILARFATPNPDSPIAELSFPVEELHLGAGNLDGVTLLKTLWCGKGY